VMECENWTKSNISDISLESAWKLICSMSISSVNVFRSSLCSFGLRMINVSTRRFTARRTDERETKKKQQQQTGMHLIIVTDGSVCGDFRIDREKIPLVHLESSEIDKRILFSRRTDSIRDHCVAFDSSLRLEMIRCLNERLISSAESNRNSPVNAK
jgi:hypothetical protein